LGISQGKAVTALVAAAAEGTLPPALQALVPVANARSNAGRALSRATIYGWLKDRRQAAGNVVALAPKAAPETGIPIWASPFMRFYCRPQKPNITEALEHPEWPADVPKPSYDQARRFLKRVDAITRNQGRMGPRALQQLKAYVARDVSQLWPGAVFVGDGHTYKQEVAHPLSGRPFRPEVTSFLDVYTRRWVGWSAALAESTWAVADALRHAVTTSTCCDIVYYDNGSGAKNKTWDDDVVGLIGRLSITKLHSAPWSSQARGVIERFHSSVLHKVARQRATYVGQRMDKEARQAVFKITRKEIEASGQSAALTSWKDFLADIEAARVAYNDRPHAALAEIIDPVSGKRRHLSPHEAWAKAILDGWTPAPIGETEAETLFRPALKRKAARGLIKLFNNDYYHPALVPLHGEEVVVGYDLHDASKVWVWAGDGRFVCMAAWDGHKRSYLPVSVAQQALEHRVAGQLARLDAHRDIALAQLPEGSRLPPGVVVQHPALTVPALTAEQAAKQAELEADWESELPGEADLAIAAALPSPVDVLQAEIAREMDAAAKVTPLIEPIEVRFRKVLALEARLARGERLAETEVQWLKRQQRQPDIAGHRKLYEDFGETMFLDAVSA
jgi:putative transposase